MGPFFGSGGPRALRQPPGNIPADGDLRLPFRYDGEEGRKRVRKRIVLPVALSVLIFLPGAGPCSEEGTGRADRVDPPIPDAARGACRTIAAILSVYPVLEVNTSEGAVRDLRDAPDRPGCRVLASGPASGLSGEVPPAESIRFLLGESGWEEDIHCSADGPGTTAFALRKNGVLCLFGGGAHSWIEDGKILTAERFEFEAGCVAAPERDGTEPGR